MTVESIKQDIKNALPHKEKPKSNNLIAITGNAKFMSIFESLFGNWNFNINEILKEYETEANEYKQISEG